MITRLSLLISLVMIVGCQADQSTENSTGRTPLTHSVSMVKVERQELPAIYPVPGTVVPQERLQITSKITGIIEQIYVDEGDIVDVGDTLVEIDNAQVTAAIKSAEANLSASKADLRDAQDDVRRFRELAKTKSLAEDQLQDAQVRVTQADSAVAQAQATLLAARQEQRYTRIISPVRAQVRERLQDMGDLAVTGTPILRLYGLGAMKLEIFVPTTRINEISKDQTVDVFLQSHDIPLQGQVESIVYSADKVTRNCKIKIALPNQSRLTPGQFGRANLILGQSSALLVPVASIAERAGIEGVFVRDELETIRFRSVRLGRDWQNKREVLAGIEAGDWVVLDPPTELHDGDRVKQVMPGEH